MEKKFKNNCSTVLNSFGVMFLKMFLIIALSYFSSCKKWVEVEPPINRVSGASVYQNDGTAISALTSLYIDLSSSTATTANYPTISLLAGLSADEFTLWNGVSDARLISFYTNNLMSTPSGGYGTEFWRYDPIFVCNAAIEGMTGNTSLTPVIKKQLLGEAKFMRAFYYFYLTNLYGDLPLVTSTDYKINSKLPRSPQTVIYNQIISDLKEAQELLSNNFLSSDLINITPERVRPTKWAAAALLSRVYLYNSEWLKAEEQASIVLNHSVLFDTSSLNNVFLMNNKEAIWQLQPVLEGSNTEIGKIFIIPSTGPADLNAAGGAPVYLSNQLLNSFEPGDGRRKIGNWVDSVNVGGTPYLFPFKYKVKTINQPVTEYLMVLRLGEQYLIRAEARAQLNNFSGSQADLNIIRKRAGLQNTTANDKSSLIAAITRERQVEMFSEWGDRWLDLKRSGTINSVMSVVTPLKGGSWSPYKALYPIPVSDIQRNGNLHQNPGY